MQIGAADTQAVDLEHQFRIFQEDFKKRNSFNQAFDVISCQGSVASGDFTKNPRSREEGFRGKPRTDGDVVFDPNDVMVDEDEIDA